MRITITWGSLTGRPTIYSALRDRLGREPTHAELRAELDRIRADALIDRAARGQLPHQRRK